MKAKKKNTTKKSKKLTLDSQMMDFVNKMGKYYESFGISRIGGHGFSVLAEVAFLQT